VDSVVGLKNFTTCILLLFSVQRTGWPKKVSHYQESSLNRIKKRQ